jgi:acyl carrier protein
VMGPKFEGLRNLERVTQRCSLDFFVTFSSIASLLGSMGQANYATANACMDAWAEHRAALGQPGLSINWGPWSEVGMAAQLNENERRRLVEGGIALINPKQGLGALERLLQARQQGQVAVLPADWPQLVANFSHWTTGGLFELVAEASGAKASVPDLLAELQTTAPAQRKALLHKHVASHVRHVLGLEVTAVVDAQQSFFEMGIDSLTSLELRKRLEGALRQSFPATLVFDYPTINALAAFCETVLPAETHAVSAAEKLKSDLVISVADLTDAEAEDLLEREIELTRSKAHS